MSELDGFIKRVRNIMREDKGVSGDSQRIEQLTWMIFLKVFDEIKEYNEYEMDPKYKSIIPEKFRWRNWAVSKKDSEGRVLPNPLTGDELIEFLDGDDGLFHTLKNINVTPETPKKYAVVKYVFENLHNYMKEGELIREVIEELNKIEFKTHDDIHVFNEIYESLLQQLESAGSAGEFYTPRPVTDFMVEMIDPKPEEKVGDFACGTGGFLVSTIKHLEKINTQKAQETIQNDIIGTEWKPLPYLLCVTNMLLNGTDGSNITSGSSLSRDPDKYTEDEKVDIVLMNPPFGGKIAPGEEKNFPETIRTKRTENLFVYLAMRRLKEHGRAAIILPDSLLFGTDEPYVNLKTKLMNEFNLHTIVKLPTGLFYANITTNILFFEKGKPTEGIWYYQVPLPEGYKSFSKTKPFKKENLDSCRAWWNNRDNGDENAYYVTMDQVNENGYDINFSNPNKKNEEIEYSLSELIAMMKEKSEKISNSIAELEEMIKDINE